jgi:4-hydroxy-tetrahydrodipicolinate reductase
MKLLLIGFGRMGRLVEELARAEGHAVVGRITSASAAADWPAADVAIDFSTGDAVAPNVAKLAGQRTNVVIGTTGWQAKEAEVRAVAERAGLGVVAAANFSIGVNIFTVLAAEAARLMRTQQDYGAWIHEAHHAAKKDAPSGTALLLREAMAGAGFGRPIDISSTRAGSIPGTHTIGFDGPSDTIELTHTARDRRGFARGALVAANWVQNRRGWFSMTDVLGMRADVEGRPEVKG